ncbi:MAG: hypothetical protein WC644_01225 [Ignavibacteria bacterium]
MKDNRFPNSFTDEYDITSPKDIKYNCIAWAVNDINNWWEPSGNHEDYWPENTRFDYTLDCLIEAYRTLGYELCEDSKFEELYDKIAIFSIDGIQYSHASKQIDDKLWASKIGQEEDIVHSLFCICGGYYGDVFYYLKKLK